VSPSSNFSKDSMANEVIRAMNLFGEKIVSKSSSKDSRKLVSFRDKIS
jgi:hypothetical protein